MNVLHIGLSDLSGGASRASYRIHQSLKNNNNLLINSKMRVIKKISEDQDVFSKNNSFHNYFYPKLITVLNQFYRYGFNTINPVLHSTARIKTGLGKELNNTKNVDLFHLHWLGDATISIEEIGSLNKPIIWTLHDQWPFCGAEHYIFQNKKFLPSLIDKRYYSNYSKESRLGIESGRDLNRLTWLRKQKNWINKMSIICPSNWMAECALKSSLFKNNPISIIPNCIDTNEWVSHDKQKSKEYLNIASNKRVILFGAIDIIKDKRKGAELLFEALNFLRKTLSNELIENIELVAFGQNNFKEKVDLSFPVKFIGHINNDKFLNIIYSAADVFVNPSIQESFGQTASESLACATPVVAFRTSGLIDIVDHLKTGYLAEPFNTKSLANGIKWILEDMERNKNLSRNCRQKALEKWDYSIVSSMYYEIYRKTLKNQKVN